MQKPIKSIALIFGVFALSLLVGYLVLAWTEPTQAPPDENVPTPLNVGDITQTKTGALNIMGNVGIGTTNPTQTLHINGITRFRTNNYPAEYFTLYDDGTNRYVAGIDTAGWYLATGDRGFTVRPYVGSLGTPWLTIQNSGNVGIGATSPQALLHVGGGTDAPGQIVTSLIVTRNAPSALSVRDSANNVEAQVYAGPGEVVLGSLTNHYVDLKTNNQTVMRLTTDRNVGIGTTNPTEKLEVDGKIKLGNALIYWDSAYNRLVIKVQ